jgi:hypothetical protein
LLVLQNRIRVGAILWASARFDKYAAAKRAQRSLYAPNVERPERGYATLLHELSLNFHGIDV